jgi:hypothetical protein
LRLLIGRNAFRWILITYALVFCGGFIPMQLWLMPLRPFRVGQVHIASLGVRAPGAV